MEFKLADKPGLFGSWKWLSLVYSLFFFFSFFWADITAKFIFVSLLIYFTFVALYSALCSFHRSLVPLLITAMVLLGIIGSYSNPSSTITFNYAAFFAGFYLSKKNTALSLCAILASLVFSAWLFELWYAYYFFPGIVPTIALAFTGTMIQQNDLKDERERKSTEEKRQLAALAERERIARDLHDTLGHTLSSISLKAQLAKKLGDRGDTQAALEEINQVAKLASSTLSEVRQAISGYRKIGLQEQLGVLRSRLEDGGIEVRLEGTIKNIEASKEAALILILTEAVTNILRHSSAKLVKISQNQNEGLVEVRVEDDGKVLSFTPGNGLKGIQERLQDLKGTLDLSIENGFCLNISFPA
ncbi:two-component system, NarL family, sensor histidine kinase DesK [Alteromonadaceae bacterium Bs31]|nr:two-component system, NarL family, sensor histidine kinase DesK [Alteromonadaceae bacterium Bs31]